MDEKVLDEDKSKAKKLKVKGGILEDEYTTDYEKSMSTKTEADDDEPEVIVEIPEHKTESVEAVGKTDDEIVRNQEDIKKARKEHEKKVFEKSKALIKEAENFIKDEDYENAEESFYQSMITNPKDWHGYFGIVKAVTHNFTSFSEFSEVEEVYQKSISLLDDEGKKELDEIYGKNFLKTIESNKKDIEKFDKIETESKAEKTENCKNVRSKAVSILWKMAIPFVLCVALCVVGIMLAYRFTGTTSMIFVIVASLSGAIAGVSFIMMMRSLSRILSANYFIKKYSKFPVTEEGETAVLLKSQNKVLSRIVEDIK